MLLASILFNKIVLSMHSGSSRDEANSLHCDVNEVPLCASYKIRWLPGQIREARLDGASLGEPGRAALHNT